MTRVRGWARRAFAAVAGAAVAGTALAAISSTPAAAITVADETTLRAAFVNPAETQIDLTADITLETCPDGVVTRNSGTALVVNGDGHTVTQTCATGSSGVFQQLGSGGLTFESITVTGGHTDAGGGGIFGNGAVTLTNSTVNGNTVVGAAAGGVFSDGAMSLTNSTVSGNSSDSGGGLFSIGALSMTNSTVSGNTSRVGGGIVSGSAALSMTNSTVSGNTATTSAGGGIQSSGTATLTNSTMSGNTASTHGGGVAALDVILIYSTVVSNTAPTGANIEIVQFDSLTSFGSVVALPQGGGTNCDFQPPPVTISNGFNFSDDDSCLFTDGTDQQNAGDPGLAALANNGGPTQTRLPLPASPLIDAIPSGSCQDDGASGITTDQRGITRPQINGCDIGAVEARATEVEPAAPPVAPPAAAPLVGAPRFTG
jgi:pectate lyase-like protein